MNGNKMNGMNGCGCGNQMNRPNNGCGNQMNRPNNGCGCESVDFSQNLMNLCRDDLLKVINEVSFAMYDCCLFLDTHPMDSCALDYFQKMKKKRKPGGGRKKLKPEYDAGKNLEEQMESMVVLYDSGMSLQAIGDALNLNPIKVRKLLITAGVYESDVAEKVKSTFEEYRETQDYQEKNRKFMED